MGGRNTVRIKVNCPLLLRGPSRVLDSNKNPFHLVLVTYQYISPYFHCLLSPRQPAGSFITMKGIPIFSHTLLPFTLAHEFFIASQSEASGLLVSVLDLIAPLFRPSLHSAARFCRLPTRKSKIFRSISLLTFFLQCPLAGAKPLNGFYGFCHAHCCRVYAEGWRERESRRAKRKRKLFPVETTLVSGSKEGKNDERRRTLTLNFSVVCAYTEQLGEEARGKLSFFEGKKFLLVFCLFTNTHQAERENSRNVRVEAFRWRWRRSR